MFWETITAAYLSDSDRRFVLVSLVGKAGSSYLQPGARMLVREDGVFWGGISAGCLEETIAESALDCLRNNQHRIMEIDTRPYFGCFGKITVLLEVFPSGIPTRRFFESIQSSLEARLTFDLATEYGDLSGNSLTRIGKALANKDCLQETVTPVPRILVFGDWPDALAVHKIACVMGWDASVFDASSPGFSVESVMAECVPDMYTAAMVMTHNFARDTVLSGHLLKLPLGYIGLIGSRKRRQEISNELSEGGDMELIDALDRLHCPAGLDLGGQGHEAIALSVIAEIQSAFHNRDAASLRLKNRPVHDESVTK